MKYAIVIDGKVDNIVEWDGKTDYKPEGELVKLKDDQVVSIGWAYKDKKFVDPAPKKPVKPDYM